MTVRNSKFFNCTLFDIFVTISGPDARRSGHKNLLLENNWFGTPWTENPGTPSRGSAVDLAWCQNSPAGYDGVTVRFNSFQANTGLWGGPGGTNCTWRDVEVVGNMLQYQGTCISGTTYAYNVWSSSYRTGTCSATDVSTGPSFPYASAGGSSMDYHVTAAGPFDDLVPASAGCPATDYDGQARPAGARCDAGADER
jgi:hypothetical protein